MGRSQARDALSINYFIQTGNHLLSLLVSFLCPAEISEKRVTLSNAYFYMGPILWDASKQGRVQSRSRADTERREGTATERKRHIALTLDPRLRPRGGTESVDLPAAPFRGGPCRPASTPSLTSSRSYHRIQCKHAGKGGGVAGRAPHCWWWVRWSSSSLASLLVEYQARTLTTWPRIWRPRPRTWRPWRRTNLHNLVFLNHVLQSRRIQ